MIYTYTPIYIRLKICHTLGWYARKITHTIHLHRKAVKPFFCYYYYVVCTTYKLLFTIFHEYPIMTLYTTIYAVGNPLTSVALGKYIGLSIKHWSSTSEHVCDFLWALLAFALTAINQSVKT